MNNKEVTLIIPAKQESISLPIVLRKLEIYNFEILVVLDRNDIETIESIKYLKHIEGTKGLYEIRIEVNSNIYRIFCFFYEGNIIVLGNAFQKKTDKTPKSEITKALKIMEEYKNENDKK